MRYTIEQSGGRWIASDGAHHVEGEDAFDAICLLLHGQAMSENTGQPVEDEARRGDADHYDNMAGRQILTLIRLLTLKAPAAVIRMGMENLRDLVEKFIALANLEQ